VVLWDLSEAVAARKSRAKKTGTGAEPAAADDAKDITVVKYLYASSLESSHRRSVSDLIWLKPGQEVASVSPCVVLPVLT
jgi:hypothetical protein